MEKLKPLITNVSQQAADAYSQIEPRDTRSYYPLSEDTLKVDYSVRHPLEIVQNVKARVERQSRSSVTEGVYGDRLDFLLTHTDPRNSNFHFDYLVHLGMVYVAQEDTTYLLHRKTNPLYRGIGLATTLYQNGIEPLLKTIANPITHTIVADTGQVNVLTWLLAQGFTPSEDIDHHKLELITERSRWIKLGDQNYVYSELDLDPHLYIDNLLPNYRSPADIRVTLSKNFDSNPDNTNTIRTLHSVYPEVFLTKAPPRLAM